MEKNIHNSYISKTLKLAISKKYNIHLSEITKDFLGSLKEIDLAENNIRDIRGIEFATNATYVNLTRNNIYDASYLSKLINLVDLELNENKIEDISFLKKLKKLKTVGLESNNISQIPNLDESEELTLINLNNNKLMDLSQFNTSTFQSAALLASDQCIVLEPIVISVGKTVLFKSNIKWDSNTTVFFDNVQVSGKYDSVYTDDRPSILYSISEIVVRNIKSNCVLKMDFYHEDPSIIPRILSGTLVQPIFINDINIQEPYTSNLEKDSSLSTIKGALKIEDLNTHADYTKHNNSIVTNKTITLINELGTKLYIYTDNHGKYCFSNIKEGKYILLFPVLAEYTYTSPSIYVLNIKNKEEYIVNGLISYSQ
ncbi:MAG: leucine-rich repeat domain-containing protein [Paraclostridium sp.]